MRNQEWFYRPPKWYSWYRGGSWATYYDRQHSFDRAYDRMMQDARAEAQKCPFKVRSKLTTRMLGYPFPVRTILELHFKKKSDAVYFKLVFIGT